MKLSKNNISKFEHIIEEEWSLLQEQIAANMRRLKDQPTFTANELDPNAKIRYTSTPRADVGKIKNYSSEEEKLFNLYLLPEPPGMQNDAKNIQNTNKSQSDNWAKFVDDESLAIDMIIQSTPTIKHYYWLNLRLCNLTKYNSLPSFILSYIRRDFDTGEVSFETWIRTLAYQENMDMAVAELEQTDLIKLRNHLQKLEASNPKVWDIAEYSKKGGFLVNPYSKTKDGTPDTTDFYKLFPATDVHGKLLYPDNEKPKLVPAGDAANVAATKYTSPLPDANEQVNEQSTDPGWYNMETDDDDYFDVTGGVTAGSGVDADYVVPAPGMNWGVGPAPVKLSIRPLNTHIYELDSALNEIQQRKADIQLSKESKKEFMDGFPVIGWVVNYLDEKPAEALRYASMIVSIFSGWGALVVAASLAAGSAKIEYDNKNYAQAGEDIFWTALFGIGSVIRIFKHARDVNKLNVIRAFSRKNATFLTQFESKLFGDLTRWMNNPSNRPIIDEIMRNRTANLMAQATRNSKNPLVLRMINSVLNRSGSISGIVLRYVDKWKYFLGAGGGYYGWTYHAWPEIYKTTLVPGTDKTYLEAELINNLKNGKGDAAFKSMPDNVKENGGSLYKDGKYIGPSTQDLDNDDF